LVYYSAKPSNAMQSKAKFIKELIYYNAMQSQAMQSIAKQSNVTQSKVFLII
jgi:hypothetical protein